MYLYINGTKRQYVRNSISITDELQERVNSAKFNLDASFAVSYYEDVKIYEGSKIVSLSGTALIVSRSYAETNLYKAGSEIWLGLGLSTQEKVTISSVNGINITLTANAKNSHSADELMGVLKFGGSIIDIKDYNIRILENLQYSITCADYTRLFDKELINESYENKTARYIVNDFCNQFINRNKVIDQFDYDNTTALRVVWQDIYMSNDPELITSDYRERYASAKFYGLSVNTMSFSSALDLSGFTGVPSGAPAKGVFGFWLKTNDYTKLNRIDIRIGSSSSHYISWTVYTSSMTSNNDWVFVTLKMTDYTSLGGTPVWNNVQYFFIAPTQTSATYFYLDGLRILEEEHFRHFPYIENSEVFSDFNIARIKPITTMQRLANELAWFWYIDYERNIRLFPSDKNIAPLTINETSDNFSNLAITYDTTRLTNQQVVKGSDEVSSSTYSQVVEGDEIIREWLMKNKFKNLVVSLDDNTSTDTMEAGTTTTNVVATSHGLITGDYIVNRTRSNAVREITRIDNNNFTVVAVTSQTSGDTFSKFVEQSVGVEGIHSDIGNNFMSNYNEKSIRNSEEEATLEVGDFLLFRYNEVVPILVQRRNPTSIDNMKTILGYTDGIFDGAPITDRTIQTRAEATALANITINKYSNVLIKATFKTTFEGLESGQLIRIKDTTSSTRNIDQDFIIQTVRTKEIEDGENLFSITCSSSLFGILELFQQLLRQAQKLEVAEDAKVTKIEDLIEEIKTTITIEAKTNDTIDEIIEISESASSATFTPPYKWGVDADQGKWNLCEWS